MLFSPFKKNNKEYNIFIKKNRKQCSQQLLQSLSKNQVYKYIKGPRRLGLVRPPVLHSLLLDLQRRRRRRRRRRAPGEAEGGERQVRGRSVGQRTGGEDKENKKNK